jgi:hypothetical protein
MRIRPGIIIAIIAVFAVLIGGRQFGWFGGKTRVEGAGGQGAGTTPAESSDSVIPTAAEPGTASSLSQSQKTPSAAIPGRGALATPAGTPAPVPTTIEEWEQRIDDVLTTAGDETQKAKQLLAFFPNLPEDGQVEAAQHISNLLPDEEYALLAPALINPQTPEEVLDVLMTDVLNRPNDLKLGTLLEVARTPNHPKAEEARDVLEVYVDENYGDDWAAWDSAVKKWLKENPEE